MEKILMCIGIGAVGFGIGYLCRFLQDRNESRGLSADKQISERISDGITKAEERVTDSIQRVEQLQRDGQSITDIIRKYEDRNISPES